MTSKLDEPNLWEFNCPQYVDFFDSVANENLESYFDVDHETGLRVSKICTNKHQEAIQISNECKVVAEFGDIKEAAGKRLKVASNNMAKEQLTEECESDEKTLSKMINSKEDKQSFSDSMSGCTGAYDLRLTPAREQMKRKYSSYMINSKKTVQEVCNTCQEYKNETESDNETQIGCITKSKISICRAIDKGENAIETSMKNNSVENSFSQNNNMHCTSLSTSSTSCSAKQRKLTLPSTPRCLKQSVAKVPKLKSSETIELQKMSEFRKHLANNRKQNEKRMRKALVAPNPETNVSTLSQHTVVKPFNFKTDERLKSATPKTSYKETDFVSSLRHCSPQLIVKSQRITKPKPFNFTESRKRKLDSDMTGSSQTLAEQVMAFHKQTPDRYHGTSSAQVAQTIQQRFSPRLTRPQSPNLQAAKRHRPITALSQEQIETIEIEQIKKYKFHARPVNPKVFAQKNLRKVKRKPATKPESIELETEKRISARDLQEKPKMEEKYEFRARALPKNILKGPVGVKEKLKQPPTEPMSPRFALKQRIEKWKETEQKEEEKQKEEKLKEDHHSSFKAHPAPHTGVPFSVKLEKKFTQLEPFSFDKKDQERLSQKEKKIQEELEKEKKMHEFRAHPMPSPSPGSIPEVYKKSPTKPKPFNLLVDQLAEIKVKKWQKEVEQEFKLQREAANFKAHPAAVLYKPPFQAEKSTKPLTEHNGFLLSTEKRASERLKLETLKRAKEVELEEQRLLQLQELEHLEREAITKFRENIVHKANPIRHYKPVEIKPSQKPPTLPQSPQFATNLRARVRI